MTLGQKIAWDDTVLPFQLDRSDIRGRIARLDATDYYGPSKDGAPARMRAYASYDAEKIEADAPHFPQIGKGYFAILIDQGNDMKPYQGITPIAGDSLSYCAGTYFAQSEQLPTRFSLTYGRSQEPGQQESWRAGGIMLQHMPKASPLMAKEEATGDKGLLDSADLLDGDDSENWNRANILLDTVEAIELIGPSVSPTDLLVRLFHEDEPIVYDTQPVTFGCTCSEDKVRQSMSIYSASDIAHMTTEEGTLTADCQFCGAHYVMDPATLGFEAAGTDDPIK